MKSDLIDLEVELHARSERGVKVSIDGVSSNAVWLPLSQIEISHKFSTIYEITLPEWLALEKGLI